MNNQQNHENVITEHKKKRHDIKKYNFKDMNMAPPIPQDASQSAQNAQLQPPPPQPQEAPPEAISDLPPQIPIEIPSLKLFETEVVDKILQKSDTLAQSLENLQAQLTKQESEMEQKLTQAKAEGKELGFHDGYQQAKDELQAQIQSQQELYALSIQKLQESIEQNKAHITNLEKELSAIALDIAKEVIFTEVSQHSAKIASSLARGLLADMANQTNITLKVFPGDFEDIKQSLLDLQHIHIEPDKAIAKGGVVIISNQGNLDGDILIRFQTLKKSILEHKE